MNATQTVAQAPGCFAAASVFGSDSKACQQCVAFAECGVASMKTLEEIKEMIDVRDILARHVKARKKCETERAKLKEQEPEQSEPMSVAQPVQITAPVVRYTDVMRVTFEVSEDQQNVIARMGNDKVKSQAIVLCKQNKIETAVKDLAAGINPFADSPPKYLRVVCDLLLSGGFTKTSCRDALVKELGWSEGTAMAHESMARSLLLSFNIIQETSGKFTLSPAVACENASVA